MIKCFAAAAVALLAYVAGPVAKPFAEQAQYLYCQRRCLTHVTKPQTPVFEGDPEAAAELVSSRAGYLRSTQQWVGWDRKPIERHEAYYFPAALAGIGRPRPSWGVRDGIAFMHGRRSPNGPRRLVIVTTEGWGSQPSSRVTLTALLFQPASWQPKSRLRSVRVSYDNAPSRNTEALVHLESPAGQPIRVFGGQPDADDESHFTIGFEIAGERGMIDGWLRGPDGPGGLPSDHLELRLHEGGPALHVVSPAWPDLSAKRAGRAAAVRRKRRGQEPSS